MPHFTILDMPALIGKKKLFRKKLHNNVMWKKFGGLDNLWHGQSETNMSCFQYKNFYWEKRSSWPWFLSCTLYSMVVFLLMHIHIGRFWTNHMYSRLLYLPPFPPCYATILYVIDLPKGSCVMLHTVHKTLAMVQTESSPKFGVRFKIY